MIPRLIAALLLVVLGAAWPLPAAAEVPEVLIEGDDPAAPRLPAGWSYGGSRCERDRCTLTFLGEGGGTFSVSLTPRDEAAPSFARSASFNISHLDPLEGLESPEGRLFTQVVAAIQRNDRGQVELIGPDPAATPPTDVEGRGGDDAPAGEAPGFRAQLGRLSTRDQVQVRTVMVLLLLAVGAFVVAMVLLGQTWRGMGVTTRRVVLLALGAAIVTRLLVEPRLVMIYWVYGFTDVVATFRELPRYGAGAATLYRLLFAATGPDHLVLVWVHTVAGILTLPAAVAFLHRHRARGPAVAIFAVLLAMTPMFIRDHRTESILVFAVFCLWYGLLLLDGFLLDRRRGCLAGAVPFLGLAVMTRPEMVVIVPAAVAVAVIARGRDGLRGPRAPLALAAATFVGLLVAQMAHLAVAVPQQVEAGALPSLNLRMLAALPGHLVMRNAWLKLEFFPVLVTAVAVLGAARPPRGARALAWGSGVLAIAWTSVYYMDLPITSEPRLHAPAAMLVALVAALGAETAAGLLSAATPRLRSAALLCLGGLVALSALPSIPSLFAPTNEDQEEALYRRVVAALPEGRACLVQISALDDPPEGKTHRFHPQYLLRPPNRDDHVFSITQWEAGTDGRCPEGGYFYLGLLCYAAVSEAAEQGAVLERVVERRCLFGADCWRVSFRTLDLSEGPREAMLSSCRRLLEASGPPVFEEDLENLGDNEFGYYPEVPRFRVGLYRLQALRP